MSTHDRASGDRPPTSHERMSGEHWDASYRDGPAPWEVGRPQPPFARLAECGNVVGPVLDAGCGTGEQAMLFAARGLSVVAFDVAETGLARAREAARRRGLDVAFVVGDALDLHVPGGPFRTVLDSGLFHTFDRDERERYVRQLAAVTMAGGMLYVLCFGDWGSDAGPHPVTQSELRDAFRAAAGWNVVAIDQARVLTRFHDENGAPAWFATIERRSNSTATRPA